MEGGEQPKPQENIRGERMALAQMRLARLEAALDTDSDPLILDLDTLELSAQAENVLQTALAKHPTRTIVCFSEQHEFTHTQKEHFRSRRHVLLGAEVSASARRVQINALRAQKKHMPKEASFENETEVIVLCDGRLKVFPEKYYFEIDGAKSESLTPKEFKLFILFAQKPTIVHTFESILTNGPWRDVVDANKGMISTCIRRIKQKTPLRFTSIYGVGYRFAGLK